MENLSTIADRLSVNILENACTEINTHFNSPNYATKNPNLLSSYLNVKTEIFLKLLEAKQRDETI